MYRCSGMLLFLFLQLFGISLLSTLLDAVSSMPQPSVNPETFLGDIVGDYRYDASTGELSLQERLPLMLETPGVGRY